MTCVPHRHGYAVQGLGTRRADRRPAAGGISAGSFSGRGDRGGGRRPGGRGLAGAFGGGGPVTPAGGAYRTSTATVTHRTLASQTELNASLGDSGSYSVVDQATGTLTALPAIGKVIRQGKVLYQVSGNPWCCCMAGSPPTAC